MTTGRINQVAALLRLGGSRAGRQAAGPLPFPSLSRGDDLAPGAGAGVCILGWQIAGDGCATVAPLVDALLIEGKLLPPRLTVAVSCLVPAEQDRAISSRCTTDALHQPL